MGYTENEKDGEMPENIEIKKECNPIKYELAKKSPLSERECGKLKCPSCKKQGRNGRHHCRICGALSCDNDQKNGLITKCSKKLDNKWVCGTNRSKFGVNSINHKHHFPGSWDKRLGTAFLAKVEHLKLKMRRTS